MTPALSLRFLGTGPAGGRPGRGRSRRRESSALVSWPGHTLLVDVTRDFAATERSLDRVDVVLLTHAHRDASGGLPRLARWLAARGAPPPLLLASGPTLRTLRRRYPRVRQLAWRELRPGTRRRVGDATVSAIAVPHSPDGVTVAWKIRRGGATLVIASDVARLTPALRRFAAGADLLVIDGAMWQRTIFTHLTIQRALPRLARWDVRRLLFTQLGRGTPSHEALDAWLRRSCPRAGAAYDGMVVGVAAASQKKEESPGTPGSRRLHHGRGGSQAITSPP